MPLRNIYILAVTVMVSLFCYMYGDRARQTEHTRMFKTFSKAMGQIEEQYVQKVNREELFQGALTGMLDELDEYSAYYDPENYRVLMDNLDQEFGGIGIQVSVDEESKELIVMSPLVGTPAYQAGILAGDRILKIEDQETAGYKLTDAVSLLRGKIGEPVRLTVVHEGQESPTVIEVVRDIIQVESVYGDTHNQQDEWDFMLAGTEHIGLIRIASFSEKTTGEIEAALKSLKRQGMRGLIIDLRNNPGGLLTTAVQVCDLFVKEGTIVTTRGREGVERDHYSAHAENTYDDFPMVVLINGYSASASEIMAACLQDHNRALIIGERSWGKGSVQNVITLRPKVDAMKITVATYWRPNGKNIHRFKDSKPEDEWGVSPNPGYEMKLSLEDYRKIVNYRRKRDVVHGTGNEEAKKIRDSQIKEAITNENVKNEGEAIDPNGSVINEESSTDETPKEGEKEENASNKTDADNKNSKPVEKIEIEEIPLESYTPLEIDPQLKRAVEYLNEKLESEVPAVRAA